MVVLHRSIDALSTWHSLDGMTDLDAWWNSLVQDDQSLFVKNRDVSPLPAEVAARVLSSSATPVVSQDGATVHWLGPTQEFLSKKASGSS